MAVKKRIHNGFYGGMADSESEGGLEQANLVQNLNLHEDEDYVVPVPSSSKVSGTVVTALPQWMVDTTPWATDRYVYDSGGNIYKVASNTFTLDRSGATIAHGAAGQGLIVWDNYLYYASSVGLGRKGLLSGTPAYSDDFLIDGTTNLDQSQIKSGQTYPVPVSISEAATALCSFTPTRDPVQIIQLIPTAKGTGDWTLTIHDKYNNTIGSYTRTNVNLTNGIANNFSPPTAARIVLNQTYHFHITSTVNDGTVQTGTAADFSTAWFQEFFQTLVDDSQWHPMAFLNGLIIGNNQYLAFWDEITYNPNRVVLDAGFRVRSLHYENEFVVAAAWKGTSVDAFQEGKLYYWDGISSVFNYSKPIDAGLPNVCAPFRNQTLTIAGSSGDIFMGTEPFVKQQTIQNLARGKKIEVAPGAVTQWETRTMIGYAYSTDDSNLLQGVYGFGNNKSSLPLALSLDFIVSTGTTKGTTLKIGMVKSFGKDLYIGWQDGSTYGVDYVTKTNGATTNIAYWHSLIFDGDQPQKTKQARVLVITFAPLNTGESVTPKYQADRSGSFTNGTTVTAGSATRAEFEINAPFREIQYGFNLVSTNGTFPKITSVYFEWDDKSEEVVSKS